MQHLLLSKERVTKMVAMLNEMSGDCEMFKGLVSAIKDEHPETADLILRLAFLIQTRSTEVHNEIVEASQDDMKLTIKKEADISKKIIETALEGQNV
jgi:hypothetical protein